MLGEYCWELMDAFDLLLGRTSAIRLIGPAPNSAELEVMLRSALRAPDHGRLRPWRFVVISEDAREHFGNLLAELLQRRQPGASTDMVAREREKAMRAPTIVVVVARISSPERIPEIEQTLSAGAAAQNILLAAHAQGYGAVWKTGPAAYDHAVKKCLGLLEGDKIVGFIYLGTRTGDEPRRPSLPPLEDFVTTWHGVASDVRCRPSVR